MKQLRLVGRWSQVVVGVVGWIAVVPLLNLGGALLERLARLGGAPHDLRTRAESSHAGRVAPFDSTEPGRRAA
jgi:hypothetical protein